MNRRSAKSRVGSFAVAAALAVTACGSGGATPPIIYVISPPAPTPTAASTPTAVSTPADTAEPTPADTEAPSPTAPPTPTPTPGVASITSVKVTDGGTSPQCGSWTVEFDKPVVSGVPAAATMNAAITAKVTAFINDFKSQTSSGGGAGPCSLKGEFEVGANRSVLIGLGFSEVVYLGGASTGAVAGSLNFIVSSGATVALADLFTTPAAGAAALSTQSRALLAAALDGDADAGAINAGTSAVISNFAAAWVLTSAGLKVTFKADQVASAASGTPSIVIPWASLKSVINPSGPAGSFVA